MARFNPAETKLNKITKACVQGMCQGMSRFNQNNERNLKECQMDPAVVKIM